MYKSLSISIESSDKLFVQLYNSTELTKKATVCLEMHLGRMQVKHHFYVFYKYTNLIVGCDFLQVYKGSIDVKTAKLVL